MSLPSMRHTKLQPFPLLLIRPCSWKHQWSGTRCLEHLRVAGSYPERRWYHQPMTNRQTCDGQKHKCWEAELPVRGSSPPLRNLRLMLRQLFPLFSLEGCPLIGYSYERETRDNGATWNFIVGPLFWNQEAFKRVTSFHVSQLSLLTLWSLLISQHP